MNIVGKYRFKYEYVSPFGEYWSIYRLWFGFIPIRCEQMVYDDMQDIVKIRTYVNSLNKKL